MVLHMWFLSIKSAAAILAILCFLLYGAYTDHKSRQIPNIVPLGIICSGLLIPWAPLPFKLVSVLFVAILLAFVTKQTGLRSGGGDTKTECALAFAVGPMATGCTLAIALSLILLWKELRKKKDNRYPLCCFIAPAFALLCCIVAGMTYIGRG